MIRTIVYVGLALMATLQAIAGDSQRSVHAVRITSAPKIDGVLDENVWSTALPAGQFTQRDPEEGKPASEPTDIRVLYDNDALYFGCTMIDDDPAGIVARLTRRDNEIESDEFAIVIDSYHDHQTGFQFMFNAAGVKIDALQYDDGNNEDLSWDPLWDVQITRNAKGWVAEVRIPFYSLRYRRTAADTAENLWGINFVRYISRKQEQDWWAFTPKNQSGFVSRFGHLTGLRDLPTPRHVELIPFVVGKQRYEPATSLLDRVEAFNGNAGLDFKYGVSSNFTLDATVNPDFGQVEADPAVLNLSTYETFYPEKRPFFIEGTQILHFTTFGGTFGPGMFYSRRIGRAISPYEVSVPNGGRLIDFPQQATILGAGKLTGKTNGGLSVGVLEAFTQEEFATVADSTGAESRQVVEPFAHYNIIRLKQDILTNSNIGTIFTSTVKDGRVPAFTNGYDWNLNLDSNTYLITGFIALSHTVDENSARKTGSAGKFQLSRVAATHWLWTFDADYTSTKYNINDAGFFFSPDDVGSSVNLTYKEDVPARIVRNYSVTGIAHIRQNFEGANLFRELGLNGQMLFGNYWRLSGSADANYGLYDERETRGRGLYGKPHEYQTGVSLSTDSRNTVILSVDQASAWDSKLKRAFALGVGLTFRPVSWNDWSVQTSYSRVRNQEAWMDSIGPNVIFGDRSTDEYNFVLRSTLTFSPELTLQLYGQLFLAKGHYANYRSLVGTSDFLPYPVSDDLLAQDFNRQSLNSNLVLRWEYSPGSTLYVVWSQARSGLLGDYFTQWQSDVSQTFRTPPANILLLKLSYWLGI